MKHRGDIVRELHFYAMAELPESALEAWWESLSTEEQEMAQQYVSESIDKVIDAFCKIGEIAERVGASMAQSMADDVKGEQ